MHCHPTCCAASRAAQSSRRVTTTELGNGAADNLARNVQRMPPNEAGLSGEETANVLSYLFSRNGVEAGSGTGADILGHPRNALVWLADLRVKQGRPLKEGEFVTLGSLIQTVWIDSGDEVVADIGGLGIAVLNL